MLQIPPSYTPFHPLASEEEVKIRERDLKRDFTAPLPVGYLIISIAIVLFIILVVLHVL